MKQAMPDPNSARSAEFTQLHMRMIALENLVISLLAEGTSRQLDLAREMASYISPRPGATPHRMTRRAALQMRHLARRALHFRTLSKGDGATAPARGR
jgi:hypothetical protein